MSNDFVKKIYTMLNPIVSNWVDYYVTYGEIVEYSSKRYRVFEGFNHPINDYNVRIELKNGYCIGIGVAIVNDSNRRKYENVNVLEVYVLGPAVEKVDDGDGCITTYPKKVMKERKMFVDGEFDIDDIEWVTDIEGFMNKYAQMEKAEVEVVD